MCKKALVLLSVLLSTNLAYAALSASTANTIKGNEPKFVATSGKNKLGFTVRGTYYSEQLGNIASKSLTGV